MARLPTPCLPMPAVCLPPPQPVVPLLPASPSFCPLLSHLPLPQPWLPSAGSLALVQAARQKQWFQLQVRWGSWLEPQLRQKLSGRGGWVGRTDWIQSPPHTWTLHILQVFLICPPHRSPLSFPLPHAVLSSLCSPCCVPLATRLQPAQGRQGFSSGPRTRDSASTCSSWYLNPK